MWELAKSLLEELEHKSSRHYVPSWSLEEFKAVSNLSSPLNKTQVNNVLNEYNWT